MWDNATRRRPVCENDFTMTYLTSLTFVDDKQWQRESREKAIERTQERSKEEKKAKLKTKDELKRLGINEQLAVRITR